jgi:tetratricopeptide (TPR) repeat protein
VPTILDLAKAPIPGALRGRSLKPALEGSGPLPERPVYSESFYAQTHFGWDALMALTDRRHQYVRAPREELYDLDRDPREQSNLAGDEAKVAADMRLSLDGLTGRVTASDETPTAAPDPKDKPRIVETYRQAIALADDRKWPQAIQLLQQLLRDDPTMAPVWRRLADIATRIDRYDVALDAYKHLIDLRPSEPAVYLGAASAELKLHKFDDARASAAMAAEMSGESDKRSVALAHDLLARIAVARRDLVTARAEAALATEADAGLHTPAYIDARALFDEGNYDEALPLFQQAADHFYTAETLSKLERYDEAETEYAEELRQAPENTRARSGLATLYHTTGQSEAAVKAVTDIIETTPTPDSYALAAKLLTAFGKPREASALRAEARRTFAPQPITRGH